LWPRFAHQFQEAGADGLELNIYFLPFDFKTPGTEYERFHVDIVKEVKKTVSIPVAVKLGFQLTSVPHVVYQLSEAGCEAVVLFNWFLNPDIDVERRRITNIIGEGQFHDSLRWVALLAERVDCDVASSGGIHQAEDIIKQILAGASCVQVCTLLYKKGLGILKDLIKGLKSWMIEHGYASIMEFKGELCFKRQELAIKKPEEAMAYFRAQYLKAYSGLGKIEL